MDKQRLATLELYLALRVARNTILHSGSLFHPVADDLESILRRTRSALGIPSEFDTGDFVKVWATLKDIEAGHAPRLVKA